MKSEDFSAHDAWAPLVERYGLSVEQRERFQRYLHLLQQAQLNVTSLRAETDIIWYHFADSLELTNLCDMNQPASVVDIGSGGGFPGIPLAIRYSLCKVVLLEVVGKKRAFLQEVIRELDLRNVTVDGTDWLTFLRSSRHRVDLFCARASLPPRDLVRIYARDSRYRDAELAYWASAQWEPTSEEVRYIRQIHTYTVGERTRKLVRFSRV